MAQRAHDARGPVWDEDKLTIAFPILLGTEVYAVVAITSAPPLYRHELIETMAGRVAEQLARVAERERAQAEVARARDEAMEASRQKSDFLATMSHEIRTPLNGVIGLNDLLLRTSLTPSSTGCRPVSRGRPDAARADQRHPRLLQDRGRPAGARAAGLRRAAAAGAGVRHAHRGWPARRSSTSWCRATRTSRRCCAGDPTRLAQVLTNLVSNAVKFTEHGGVAVRATAEPDEGRVRLRVEVADTGVGVPRSKLADLFQPFTQGDSSTTRIYGGTGLGLAISSELVDAMGGTLEYAANPGGGSVFTCTVVLDLGVESTAANRGDVMARELLHGRRALVVADESHGSVLTEQLAWWGVRSDRVASAAEATPAARRRRVRRGAGRRHRPGHAGRARCPCVERSPRRTWPGTSGSPCYSCWEATRAPTR